MNNEEKWLPVVGYEESYEVSSFGSVRSKDRCVRVSGKHGPYTSNRKGVVLKPGPTGTGHLSVVLGREAGSRTVHSLVAEAFIGERPPKHDIDHKDRNPKNNHVENLHYVTRSYSNMNSSKKSGILKSHTSVRYTPDIVLNGVHRRLGLFDTYEEALAHRKHVLATEYGIHL